MGAIRTSTSSARDTRGTGLDASAPLKEDRHGLHCNMTQRLMGAPPLCFRLGHHPVGDDDPVATNLAEKAQCLMEERMITKATRQSHEPVHLLVSSVLVLAASIAIADAGEAARCKPGYVWRERFEGDVVCVTPDQRYKLENGRCRSGYVWRDSFSGDSVCVTPAQRAAAKKNSGAAAPTSGGAGGSRYCPNGKTKDGICFF